MNGFPILYGARLSQHTTLRVGGPADMLAMPMDAEKLAAMQRYASCWKLDFRVLGGGSNLLVSDEGVRGVVIKLHPKGFKELNVNGNGTVRVGAAHSLQSLVRKCAKAGLSGMEPLTGIPGTVGGALRMNAGGPRGEISDSLLSVRIVRDGKVQEVHKFDCGFRYRDSALKDAVVTGATFKLAPSTREAVTSRTREFDRHKFSVQPMSLHSAGCMFTNPPGESAGRLIDKAGLKGAKIGGACVSSIHGNFLFNDGTATCSDFLELIDRVRNTVLDAFNVELKTEVQTWGCNIPAFARQSRAA